MIAKDEELRAFPLAFSAATSACPRPRARGSVTDLPGRLLLQPAESSLR